MSKQQHSGWSATPIQLRTHAPRQTQAHKTRTSDAVDYDVEDNEDAWREEKPHTSAVRYDKPPNAPNYNTAYFSSPKKTKLIKQRRFDKYTLIIILCLAFMVMVLGWFIFSLISSWWTSTIDDWKYGNPRTYQTDQFVGQGDSPDHPDHFMVVNTHGQVIVIQLNPQHAALDHIYGITTTSDPKTPVSLVFRPTGNTWAMYVVVGDANPYSVELVSNGKQFVSPN